MRGWTLTSVEAAMLEKIKEIQNKHGRVENLFNLAVGVLGMDYGQAWRALMQLRRKGRVTVKHGSCRRRLIIRVAPAKVDHSTTFTDDIQEEDHAD